LACKNPVLFKKLCDRDRREGKSETDNHPTPSIRHSSHWLNQQEKKKTTKNLAKKGIVTTQLLEVKQQTIIIPKKLTKKTKT
jgi:hypothetical protein